MASGKFNFAIDRGGTFTDVFAICPDGKQCVMKLLSVSPEYPDAPTEGIRRILQQVKILGAFFSVRTLFLYLGYVTGD